MNSINNGTHLDRRSFVSGGSLYLLGAGLGLSHASNLFADESKRAVRLGLVTDLHYADKPPAGTRHYRETLAKLEDAARQFQQDRPDHVVELGDFIDAADSVEVEQEYLKRINKDFSALPGKKHYVLGNHCCWTLTKEEFLDNCAARKPFYSFDRGGFHFVVLDRNHLRTEGGDVPYDEGNYFAHPRLRGYADREQLEWLRADLAATDLSLVLARRSSCFRTVLPSKLSEAMGAGNPIILGVEGEAQSLLERAQAGVCVPPEDADALAAAIVRLADEPETRAEMARRGRAFVAAELDRRVWARRYIEFLEHL